MKSTLVHSPYTTTKTEVQTSVLDWIQAVDEFHRYYLKLSKVLEELKHPSRSVSLRSTCMSRRYKSLVKLRQYMNDVLETLLLDMNKSTVVPFYDGDSAKSSKTGQLATHAQLLNEINQKISQELAYFTTAQA